MSQASSSFNFLMNAHTVFRSAVAISKLFFFPPLGRLCLIKYSFIVFYEVLNGYSILGSEVDVGIT